MNERLVLLDSLQAQIEWDQAAPALKQAMFNSADPEKELRVLRARVANGISQLWKVEGERGIQAWATTYLYQDSTGDTVAQINFASADDAEEFTSMMSMFEEWAKGQGVNWIEIHGRKGWEKLLRPHGFSHNYTSLIKQVYTELH